ncbi:hypothetical protein DPMN_060247 [Dreissena polymorpha]|uniref:EGF-like domain-containing protein n=2 Tax=Dreissena polymorpha TaxID=45954 RepID=A0A9D4C5E4_DREPO|nr:hypothetical protein DPMN_060247 [Dreissena polymorpha]
MVFVHVWYVDGCTIDVAYDCNTYKQKEEVTVGWCWDITKLFRCKESSWKPVYELGLCSRKKCCPGYQGPSCEPVCFDPIGCPNGGICKAPGICECKPGFIGNQCDDINECDKLNGGCSHECTNTPGSYRCSCPEGFNMATNMLTCIEIRTTTLSPPPGACTLNNGNCSDTCVETNNDSRHCYCPKGYEISENGSTCKVMDLLPSVIDSTKDNFLLDVILMLSLSLITLLLLLVMCCFRRKSFDWHVKLTSSMTYLVRNVKQRWGDWRKSKKPMYEKIRTVQEEYEHDYGQNSDLKRQLITNEDICNI